MEGVRISFLSYFQSQKQSGSSPVYRSSGENRNPLIWKGLRISFFDFRWVSKELWSHAEIPSGGVDDIRNRVAPKEWVRRDGHKYLRFYRYIKSLCRLDSPGNRPHSKFIFLLNKVPCHVIVINTKGTTAHKVGWPNSKVEIPPCHSFKVLGWFFYV